MKIRISNITLDATESNLMHLFAPYGIIEYAIIYRNSLNGRSLKSGEVCMPASAQARQAIVSLDGTIFQGKVISVSALPNELY